MTHCLGPSREVGRVQTVGAAVVVAAAAAVVVVAAVVKATAPVAADAVVFATNRVPLAAVAAAVARGWLVIVLFH